MVGTEVDGSLEMDIVADFSGSILFSYTCDWEMVFALSIFEDGVVWSWDALEELVGGS